MDETMNTIIENNDTKQISENIDHKTTIVLSDGTTLEQFETRYNSLSKDMTELCIMASKLAKFNRKIFKDYAVDTMGISNATVAVMIKAGDLYIDHEGLQALPYSKTYELQPVAEQVDDFVETVGGYDYLPSYSQADLRALVKDYINQAKATISDTDTTEDITEEGDQTDTEETPETIEDATTPTPIEIALKAVADFLSQYELGDELDTDDIQAFKMYTKVLPRFIRKGVQFQNE